MSAALTRRQFVENLAEVALDGAVRGQLSVMTDPPGRRPALELSARSEWFKALDEDDSAIVAEVIRATAYAVLHSVLCVLDGVATVVEGTDKGHLRLVHATSTAARDLTESNGELP
jgi:hypothetical protein